MYQGFLEYPEYLGYHIGYLEYPGYQRYLEYLFEGIYSFEGIICVKGIEYM